MLFALVLAILVQAQTAWAADDQTLGVEILRDAPAGAAIEDICCGALNDGFAPVDGDDFLTGMGSGPIWLRLDTGGQSGTLLFGSFAEDVILYQQRADGSGFVARRSGKLLPADQRETIDIHVSFEIDASAGVYFARIDQISTIRMSPTFLPSGAFEVKYDREIAWHLFFAGATIIMIIFNLILGIAIREKLFSLNALVVFLTFVNGLVLSGIGPSYVWENWAPYTIYLFDFTVIFGSSTAAIFLYVFLDNPQDNSNWVKAILIFPLLFAFTLLVWWFVPTWIMQLILVGLNSINTLYALLALTVLSVRGDQRARLMLPTLLAVLVPGNAVVFVSAMLGVDSPIPREHVFELMIFTEALLFSLVLAYRIRLAQNDATAAYDELERVQSDTNRRIIESLDRDRERIASDLHDTAGQGLVAISMRLRQLIGKVKVSKTARQELDEIVDYSAGVVGDIRRISHDLHPAIIRHLGWKSAVQELFNGLAGAKDISTDVNFDIPDVDLDDFQQLNVYRVVQEICTNIAKHSDATACSASFTGVGEAMRVTINDNSETPAKANKAGAQQASLGTLVVNQRVGMLGGSWSHSITENGLRFEMEIPLKVRGETTSRETGG